MAVCAFHLSASMPKQPFLAFTRHGDLGVDFFFVLSGFIIIYVHQQDIGDFRHLRGYITKRLVRIYPLYWLATLATIVGTLVGFGSKHLPHNIPDALTTLSLVRFSGFVTPVAPAWTLFHEVVFYLLFSTLILNRTVGISVLVLWVILVLANFNYPDHDHPTIFGTVLGAPNLDFIFGMGAFFAYRKFQSIAASLTAAGLVGFIALMAWDHVTQAAVRPMYGIALALLIAGTSRLEQGWSNFAILAAIGDASYAIYLFHESLQSRLLNLANHLVGGGAGPKFVYLIVLAVSIALGCVIHFWIEKPLLRSLRRRIRARSDDAGRPRKLAGEIRAG